MDDTLDLKLRKPIELAGEIINVLHLSAPTVAQRRVARKAGSDLEQAATLIYANLKVAPNVLQAA